MAWAYVAGHIETATTNSPPTGAAADDVLICAALNTGSGSILTPPSGWTEIQADPNPADFGIRVFYRVMQSGDTSWTWTWDAGTQQQTTVAIRGADTTTPVDVSSATQSTAVNTLATASVDPVGTDGLFVGIWSSDAANRTWTQDASLTERVDGDGGTPLNVCVATEVLTSGAALTRSATVSGTAQDIAAYAVVLKLAAGTDATATPAVIGTTATLPRPAADIQAAPSAVAATTALPQATRTAVTLVQPASITATATLPTAGAGTTAAPATLAAIISLPRPAVNVGVGPAVIPVTVSLPQATVETGGNATAAPAVVAATVSIPQPGVNVSAGPAVVATTVSLPQSAVNVAAGPAVVPVTVTLPSVGVNSGTGPQVIAAIVALPTPGANVSAGPVVIPVTVSLPQPTAVDEGAQVNGTSTPTVSGLAAVAAVSHGSSSTPTVSWLASVATAAALAAVAAVSHGNSSTPTVSDG